MKIAMVCPYSLDVPGGVQNHAYGLGAWLETQGHQVSIIAPSTRFSPGQPGDRIVAVGASVPVRFNGSTARLALHPRVKPQLVACLDWADLVHIHEPLTPMLGPWALRHARVPVVGTFHTSMATIPGLGALINRLGWNARLDAGIAVSSAAASVARSHMRIEPRIIGNGIDLAAYPWPRRQTPPGPPQIVFVGRFEEPRKGFEVLERAWPIIRRHHPDARLVVIGAGTPRPLLGVDYVGPCDDETRNQIIATSQVMVAPNIGGESFGIILLEALACGTSIVASSIPAFVDVLAATTPVGRLSAPGDHEALAHAVLEAIEHPDDPEANRRRASDFDWSHIGPQVVQCYDDALRSPRRRR